MIGYLIALAGLLASAVAKVNLRFGAAHATVPVMALVAVAMILALLFGLGWLVRTFARDGWGCAPRPRLAASR